ncbi:MAG: hypothetical protein WC635_07665 [Bacteriovorax sp.]|jgi:hypothetical protein
MKTAFSTMVIALMLIISSATAAEDMSLRDAQYKKEHLEQLGPRKGYQGNKDWDNFVKLAPKYQDMEILSKMLGVEPSATPTENAQYVFDLFSVYKEQPEFFVVTAHKFYKGDMDCVARLFKTNPTIITEEELTAPFKTKFKKKEFGDFISVVKKLDYTKENVSDTIKATTKCQQIKHSKH